MAKGKKVNTPPRHPKTTPNRRAPAAATTPATPGSVIDDGSANTGTSSKKTRSSLELFVEASLLEDIEQSGGISAFLPSNETRDQKLSKLFDENIQLYGKKGSGRRQACRYRVKYLRSLPVDKYLLKLKEFKVRSYEERLERADWKVGQQKDSDDELSSSSSLSSLESSLQRHTTSARPKSPPCPTEVTFELDKSFAKLSVAPRPITPRKPPPKRLRYDFQATMEPQSHNPTSRPKEPQPWASFDGEPAPPHTSTYLDSFHSSLYPGLPLESHFLFRMLPIFTLAEIIWADTLLPEMNRDCAMVMKVDRIEGTGVYKDYLYHGFCVVLKVDARRLAETNRDIYKGRVWTDDSILITLPAWDSTFEKNRNEIQNYKGATEAFMNGLDDARDKLSKQAGEREKKHLLVYFHKETDLKLTAKEIQHDAGNENDLEPHPIELYVPVLGQMNVEHYVSFEVARTDEAGGPYEARRVGDLPMGQGKLQQMFGISFSNAFGSPPAFAGWSHFGGQGVFGGQSVPSHFGSNFGGPGPFGSHTAGQGYYQQQQGHQFGGPNTGQAFGFGGAQFAGATGGGFYQPPLHPAPAPSGHHHTGAHQPPQQQPPQQPPPPPPTQQHASTAQQQAAAAAALQQQQQAAAAAAAHHQQQAAAAAHYQQQAAAAALQQQQQAARQQRQQEAAADQQQQQAAKQQAQQQQMGSTASISAQSTSATTMATQLQQNPSGASLGAATAATKYAAAGTKRNP